MFIIEETIEGTAGYTIRYLYDDNNLLLGFIYNNTTYYYQRTLTGDIARIVDEFGEIKGEYIYDAFGNILNIDNLSDIARINPYRYKGYYYDTETNLFLVSSRYYSSELYRFISSAPIEVLEFDSVNGMNLFISSLNQSLMKNINLLEDMVEYKISINHLDIKNLFKYELIINPLNNNKSYISNEKNTFWKDSSSPILNNFDSYQFANGLNKIVRNTGGVFSGKSIASIRPATGGYEAYYTNYGKYSVNSAHSGGGGIHLSNGCDDDLIDIILEMNLW